MSTRTPHVFGRRRTDLLVPLLQTPRIGMMSIVTFDLALFVLRVAVGAVAIALGLRGLAFATSAGFWGLFTVATEALGGLLTIGGLGGPIGPGVVAEMLLVVVVVAGVPPRFWDDGARLGWEFPALRAMSKMSPRPWQVAVAAGASALAILGNGAWSLDHAIGLEFSDPFRAAWLAILAVCVFLVIVVRAAVGRAIAKGRPSAR